MYWCPIVTEVHVPECYYWLSTFKISWFKEVSPKMLSSDMDPIECLTVRSQCNVLFTYLKMATVSKGHIVSLLK